MRELQALADRDPRQAVAVRAAVVDLSTARAEQLARRPGGGAFRYRSPVASAAAFEHTNREGKRRPLRTREQELRAA